MRKYFIFIFLLLFFSASNASSDIELKRLRSKFLKVIEHNVENYMYFVLTIETNGADLNQLDESDKKSIKDKAKKIAHSSYTDCIEKNSSNYSTNPIKLFYQEVINKSEFPFFMLGREDEHFQLFKNSWLKEYSIKLPQASSPSIIYIISSTDDSEIEAVEYNGAEIRGEAAKSFLELMDLSLLVKKCTMSQVRVLK